MIENKQQLKTIMHMDKRALGMKKKHPSLVGDDIWKFEKSMNIIQIKKVSL